MAEANAVTGAERSGENTFESSARALSEFVIRAVVLPVTLLVARPSTILKSTETGNYRPLPSPFLLALVAGVVASGITSNLDKLNIALRKQNPSALSDFISAVVGFYGNVEGLKSLLFSLPFVGLVWLIAGLTSILMGRGLRNVEPLFAGYSFCFAAVIELAAIMLMVTLTLAAMLGPFAYFAMFGLALVSLIYATKLVWMIFAMRQGGALSWVGASVAAFIALSVVVLFGAAGGGFSTTIIAGAQVSRMENLEKEMAAKKATTQDKTDRALNSCRDHAIDREDRPRDLDLALHYCDRAVEISPNNFDALAKRGFVHLLRNEPVAAYADYNKAVRLFPNSDRIIAGRGLVHLVRKEYSAAYADYDLAVKRDGGSSSEYLYGRGRALLGLGRKAEGAADIAAAVAMDSRIESHFAYGVNLPPPLETAGR